MSTLYAQVGDALRAEARRHDLPLNRVLPPVEQLAARWGCGAGTVRRALRELAAEGVLHNVRNRGSVVVRRPTLGRVALLPSVDFHTNQMLQPAIAQALGTAGLGVELVPPLGTPAALAAWVGERLRQPQAPRCLLMLAPERYAQADPAAFGELLAGFAHRVWFSPETSAIPAAGAAFGVALDHQAGARQVVRHLLAQGHRRVGLFADYYPGASSVYATTARWSRDLLEMAGATGLLAHANVDGPRLVREAGITAYWDLSDHTATNNLIACHAAGLRVPQDLALVGRNDTPWSLECRPSLTTLSWAPTAVAAALVAAARAALAGEPPPPTAQLIEPQLIIRQSTGG